MVTIDYTRNVLRLGSDSAAGQVVPLSSSNRRLPILDIILDGAPVQALFDTGAPTCNIDAYLSPQIGMLERHRAVIGRNEHELEFRVKDMKQLRQSTGAVAVIGLNFMPGRTILIDGPHRQVVIG